MKQHMRIHCQKNGDDIVASKLSNILKEKAEVLSELFHLLSIAKDRSSFINKVMGSSKQAKNITEENNFLGDIIFDNRKMQNALILYSTI